MSSRTPNFRLNNSFTWFLGQDSRTLEKFSFVRPIEYRYVPQHVIENKQWCHYNQDEYVFVYTKLGFVLVPKRYVEEIG